MYFTITGVKKIVRNEDEDFVKKRFVISRFHVYVRNPDYKGNNTNCRRSVEISLLRTTF